MSNRLHIAFINIPAHGHVIPTIPVVGALVRRGHRVTYATTDRYAAAVSRAGASVLRYHSLLESRAARADATQFVRRLPLLLLEETATTVPVFAAHFAADLPDVLVYDTRAGATAGILAHKMGQPLVELSPTLASNARFSLGAAMREYESFTPPGAEFYTKARELLDSHGLSEMSLEEFQGQLAAPDGRTIVFAPREFQPAGDTFGKRHVFVGPCLGDRSFYGSWRPPDGDAPILLCYLGSALNTKLELLRLFVDSFGNTPWHVVMPIGEIPPEQLGSVPPNIEIQRHIPNLNVLEHAKAFVFHAGIGSIMEAVQTRTPMVAIPQSAEQKVNAQRMAELGLGEVATTPDLVPNRFYEIVSRLAEDTATADHIEDMRAHLYSAGGDTLASDAIEDMATRVPISARNGATTASN